MGMSSNEGDKQEILAEIPYEMLYGYDKTLRSITGGVGKFSYEFLKYQQTSSEVQAAEVQKRADLM